MEVQLTRQDIIERDPCGTTLRTTGTRPNTTFVLDLALNGGLMVDRAAVPNEGSLMLMSTDSGFRLQRATKQGARGIPDRNSDVKKGDCLSAVSFFA